MPGKLRVGRRIRRPVIVVLVMTAVATVVPVARALAAPPDNDDIGAARAISTVPFSESLDTREATTAAGDPSCAGRGATVWYTLTPPRDLTISANTFGSNYDTTLSLYTGSPGSLTQVRCNDDAAGTLQSQLSLAATAGTTYHLMVGSFGGGPGGDLRLAVDGFSVLIDDATGAYYNDRLGTTLDGTGPQFPCASLRCGDPFFKPVPEPDLSPAADILGGWLSANPLPLNANWSGPRSIPATWPVNTETAIVYSIDAGPNGIENARAEFGVDNGVFVWLDGVFRFGALEPFGAFAGEYSVDLGNLAPGTHFLQVLREDHGGLTGYTVRVTGTPVESPPIHDTMTSAGCSPNPVLLNGTTSCTGTVTDQSATPTTPTGGLEWSTSSPSGSFESSSCTLSGVSDSAAKAACAVDYTASALGSHLLSASYGGDATHAPSADDAEVTAICGFSGFLPPIENEPTVNAGKAGRTYPVKFQCQDANGEYISDLATVSSILEKHVGCDDFAADQTDAIEASTSGKSILRYDSTDNQFVYNWQTPKVAGCYVLFVNLSDGQTYRANFELS